MKNCHSSGRPWLIIRSVPRGPTGCQQKKTLAENSNFKSHIILTPFPENHLGLKSNTWDIVTFHCDIPWQKVRFWRKSSANISFQWKHFCAVFPWMHSQNTVFLKFHLCVYKLHCCWNCVLCYKQSVLGLKTLRCSYFTNNKYTSLESHVKTIAPDFSVSLHLCIRYEEGGFSLPHMMLSDLRWCDLNLLSDEVTGISQLKSTSLSRHMRWSTRDAKKHETQKQYLTRSPEKRHS